MRARWTTASRLERAIACPASTILPETPRPETNASIYGKAMHEAVLEPETWAANTRESVWPKWVVKAVEDKLDACGFRGVRDAWYARTEVKGVILPDGAAFVASDFPLDERSIRVRMDFVGEHTTPEHGEAPMVGDLKTGRHAPEPDCIQVQAAAIVALDASGAHGVYCAVDHFPRYPKPDPPRRDLRFVPAAEINRTRRRIERAREEAFTAQELGGRVPVELLTRPGEHCTYCPCRPNCPEQGDIE